MLNPKEVINVNINTSNLPGTHFTLLLLSALPKPIEGVEF